MSASKKDGSGKSGSSSGPVIKFYELPETMVLFEEVRVWLQKNCKKVSFK